MLHIKNISLIVFLSTTLILSGCSSNWLNSKENKPIANNDHNVVVSTEPTTSMSKYIQYNVKAGDTVSKIAKNKVLSLKNEIKCIKIANNLNDDYLIHAGQTLNIPSVEECQKINSATPKIIPLKNAMAEKVVTDKNAKLD